MFIKKNFQQLVDSNFINLLQSNDIDYIAKISLSTWGQGNHSKNREVYKYGSSHIKIFFDIFGKENFRGNFLEIGCGEGIDLINEIVNISYLNEIYAVDIGENIEDLSYKNKLNHVKFIRCNCLNLPFNNEVFNTIYSWGVFHHTGNFEKALNEALRCLSPSGNLFFYTYKKQHGKIKKFGTFLEIFLMKFLKKINNYYLSKLFCYFLSIFLLLIFSYPSKIISLFNKKIAKTIPYNWGWKPNDIILSVLDRLLAPINTRYSKKELENIFEKIKFIKKFIIIERNEGHFIKITKNDFLN